MYVELYWVAFEDVTNYLCSCCLHPTLKLTLRKPKPLGNQERGFIDLWCWLVPENQFHGGVVGSQQPSCPICPIESCSISNSCRTPTNPFCFSSSVFLITWKHPGAGTCCSVAKNESTTFYLSPILDHVFLLLSDGFYLCPFDLIWEKGLILRSSEQVSIAYPMCKNPKLFWPDAANCTLASLWPRVLACATLKTCHFLSFPFASHHQALK